MSQDIINEYLKREIDREVMIKRAVEKTQITDAKRRAEARRKIEILKESQAFEDVYFLDF